jgi:hypothetical protein
MRSHGAEVVMGGLIGALKFSNTKQPRPGSTFTRYGMFDLEDMQGLVGASAGLRSMLVLVSCLCTDAVVVRGGLS